MAGLESEDVSLAAATSRGTHPAAVVETHCPYCALQCGMGLVASGGSLSLDVVARNFPTNRGAMCRKGWTAAEVLDAPDRLTTPLIRDAKGGALRAASWPEAIARIAGAMRDIQRVHGPDAVGVFGGGGLTNETAYMLGKFARVVLRTKCIDYNGRFCMASAAVALQKAFGIDRGLPFPVTDLPEADVIFVLGANPAETMPPLMQYFDAQRARGGRLVVADPRHTLTATYAAQHLQLAPGTDVALANGLLHVVVRDGLIDADFIAERTRGFESVRQAVASYWPDRVERITGVSARRIVEVAHMLGEAKTAIFLSGRGAEQQLHGVDNVLAFINLALALGKAGKVSCGFGCLTGQGNGQGGREHGQKSDQLPGYRKLDDPADRQHIAALWDIAESDLPGRGPSACEMLDTLGLPGGVHALMVMGSNLAVCAPDAQRVDQGLARLGLLVVADLFLSETACMADVVLPVCQWAEHEGTMTNLEGRILRRSPAKAPPEGVRSDLEILKLLAHALGRGEAMAASPEAAFEELRRTSAGGAADYAGVSYARILSGESLFWPCPTEDHPGTPRMFLERFATDDGRARFHRVEQIGPAETPDEEYPLYLTTGRVLAHYQTGTQTMRVPSLRQAEPESFVEIHPNLAATFGIADGDWVALRTRRGRATVKARLSRGMRLDTVFMPFHFGGPGRANILTSAALDASSKIPEFKVAAVALERADRPEWAALIDNAGTSPGSTAIPGPTHGKERQS